LGQGIEAADVCGVSENAQLAVLERDRVPFAQKTVQISEK